MQPDLFDVGERLPERSKDRCTPLGVTPAETCGSCRHATATETRSGKRFYKCGLMRPYWTHGGATDIKLKWTACGQWEGHRATT